MEKQDLQIEVNILYDNLDTDNRVYLIYCDIGNYKHWIKESTIPKKFFSNYEKLCSALAELISIDYAYHDPLPADELTELQDNKQKYIQDFLTRAWAKTNSDAKKLKTDKGRNNKIKTFFDSLEPYKEHFSDKTIELINTARKEQPDYSININTRREKNTAFLSETEKKISELKIKDMSFSGGCNKNDYWFYVKNKPFIEYLIGVKISSDVFTDICKLYFVYSDYRKIKKFLIIKYSLNNDLANLLSLSINRVMSSHRDYRNLKEWYIREPNYTNRYIIFTHGSPCEKCRIHDKKIYNISDAQIGKNFPPFCGLGCSTAHRYTDYIEINDY